MEQRRWGQVRLWLAVGLLMGMTTVAACEGEARAPAAQQSQQPTASPHGRTTQSSCEDQSAGEEGSGSVAVYYWCVNHLRPLRYVPADTPMRQLLAEYQRPLSRAESQAGWHGGISQAARFTVTSSTRAVTMDIDPVTVQVQRLLGTFPWPKPMERTVKEAVGSRLRVLIGGRTLCQLSDECGGARSAA